MTCECVGKCGVGAWNNARLCIMNEDLHHLSPLHYRLPMCLKNYENYRKYNTEQQEK